MTEEKMLPKKPPAKPTNKAQVPPKPTAMPSKALPKKPSGEKALTKAPETSKAPNSMPPKPVPIKAEVSSDKTKIPPSKPSIKDEPSKPAMKNAPVKPPLKETPAKPDVKEAPFKPAIKEAPAKPAIKEVKADAQQDKKEDGQKQTSKKSKPEKPSKKKANVEDKNLKVVESALSVEELNQRKQRKIRNATYAMSAIVILLIVALIIILLWPAEERVEAKYDLTFERVPSVVSIEHSIYDSEINGNIITFTKPITIENPSGSNFNGFTNFIMSVRFYDGKNTDVTNKILLRLNEANKNDVYFDDSYSAIVGNNDVVYPNHFYVDLEKASNQYIYFKNVIAQGDAPYSAILGFVTKDNSILEDELTMKVTFYGFNAENLTLKISASGTGLESSNGVFIPCSENYINKVEESVSNK